MYTKKPLLLEKSSNITFYIRRVGSWLTPTAYDIFNNNKSLIIFLKGAYIDNDTILSYDSKVKNYDYDNVYCCCVNDSFVMNQWASDLNIKNIKMLPDGNKDFCNYLNLLSWDKTFNAYLPLYQEVEIFNNKISYRDFNAKC